MLDLNHLSKDVGRKEKKECNEAKDSYNKTGEKKSGPQWKEENPEIIEMCERLEKVYKVYNR